MCVYIYMFFYIFIFIYIYAIFLAIDVAKRISGVAQCRFEGYRGL